MNYLAPLLRKEIDFLAPACLWTSFSSNDFTDEDTSAALGLASKALRHEWLKHLGLVPYYVVVGPSPVGAGFLAREGKTGRPFKISLFPFDCLAYTDEAAILDRRGGKKYLVFRKPDFFVDIFIDELRSLALLISNGLGLDASSERFTDYNLEVKELGACIVSTIGSQKAPLQ